MILVMLGNNQVRNSSQLSLCHVIQVQLCFSPPGYSSHVSGHSDQVWFIIRA
jgi:hypothetical protein